MKLSATSVDSCLKDSVQKLPYINKLTQASIIASQFVFINAAAADQSFEQLIANIESLEVVSASKKAEPLFEAPTAISSISSREISRSGARNIPEALRLVPGLIVSEASNGIYDVHIRGLDGIPVDRTQTYATTQNLLVLIDRQVFYDRNFGSIEWTALPVALEDIKRIEVVRGANSALYGANAVTGVIHILTKSGADMGDGLQMRAHLGGGNQSNNQYLSAGGKINDQLSSRFSVFNREMDRYQDEIYSLSNNTYQSTSTPLTTVPTGTAVDIDRNLPFGDTSDKTFGWNSNFRLDLPNNETEVSMGRSRAQSVSIKNASQSSPLTSTEADFKFFKFYTKSYGFDLQFDYLKSDVENFFSGTPTQFITYTKAFQTGYELMLTDTIHSRLEYRISALSPTNNTFYGNNNYAPGPYYERSVLSRTDMKFGGLRFVIGLGYDNYDTPDLSQLAFQLLATYEMGDTIFRAGLSRAHRSPYYEETIVDDSIPLNPAVILDVEGNPNLPLLEARQFEFGFRHLLPNDSSLDLEFWITKADQFTTQTVTVVDPPPPPIIFDIRYQDIPTEALQYGITGQWLQQITPAISLKAYLTLQKTDTKNVFYDLSDLSTAVAEANHESTPRFFGGLVYDHQLSSKLSANVNAYFMDGRLYRLDPYTESGLGVPGVAPDNVPPVFALNSKINYEIEPGFEVYAYGRNLLRDDKRQFLYSDDAGREFTLGFNLKL